MINGMKIGIALGSGSARGWSHIGVLRTLLRHGIAPDVVTGTSIGALVGAYYAADKLQELEEWVTSLSWREVVSLLDLRLDGGLIEGRKVFQFIEQHLQDHSFEKLAKPFAAVATDLHTGREVWLQHGHLAEAVRASISIPGLFTPYRTQSGRFLVDGGLVNPVPVSLCRAMGADLVIAVNLNAEIVGKHLHNSHKVSSEFTSMPATPTSGTQEAEQDGDFLHRLSRLFSGDEGGSVPDHESPAPGVMEVIASSINIMQDRVTRSRMAGDPADLVLTPRLSHMGLMEFYRAAEAITEGEQTVEFALSALHALLDLEQG